MHQIDIQIDPEYVAQIDATWLVTAVEATLRHQQAPRAQMTVVVTSDEESRRLNRLHRGVDAPTDVLSFSNVEHVPDTADLALPPDLADELGHYLGDLVIAWPYVEAQARRYDNPLVSELRLLAVHGTLHLLGFDHADAEQEAAMWAVQTAILVEFGDEALTHRIYAA